MHALAAIFLALALGAALPPLTDSQATRLETATDRTGIVDEAAFYALLENAREWPDADIEPEAPDYQALRDDPQAWRGRPVLIVGALETSLGTLHLARSGWEGVLGLVIRPDDGRPVIVFLTDPPDLTGSLFGETVPAERGRRVHIPARFYKLIELDSRAGQPTLYPAFVGRRVHAMDTPGAGAIGQGMAIVLLILILLGVFYLVFRLSTLRRQYLTGGGRAEAYRRKLAIRREAADHRGAETEPDAEPAPDADLPADPADALDTLSRRRDEDA